MVRNGEIFYVLEQDDSDMVWAKGIIKYQLEKQDSSYHEILKKEKPIWKSSDFFLFLFFTISVMELLINDFISKIENEFEDLTPGSVKPDTNFRNHFDWTSVNALVLFSMINVEYGVTLTAEDLQKSITIQDLFEIITSKVANG